MKHEKKFSCVSLFLFLVSQYSWNKKYNLADVCFKFVEREQTLAVLL
jgi:hypothetical protein